MLVGQAEIHGAKPQKSVAINVPRQWAEVAEPEIARNYVVD